MLFWISTTPNAVVLYRGHFEMRKCNASEVCGESWRASCFLFCTIRSSEPYGSKLKPLRTLIAVKRTFEMLCDHYRETDGELVIQKYSLILMLPIVNVFVMVEHIALPMSMLSINFCRCTIYPWKLPKYQIRAWHIFWRECEIIKEYEGFPKKLRKL